MRAAKTNVKSRTITIDDYYNERFLRLEIEMKHLREDFNRRFDDIRDDMNRRFEAVEKRFDESDRRFDALTRRIDRFMIWSFGMTFTSTGLIIAAMKFWK